MRVLCVGSLLMTVFILQTESQQQASFVVTAPDVFHFDEQEKVWVTIYEVAGTIPVTLYLQDFDKTRTFSSVTHQVTSASPTPFQMMVSPANLPESVAAKQYVYLVAKSDDPKLIFRKEVRILISSNSGFVFLQTDKPIYQPKDTAYIRVYTTDRDTLPANRMVRLDIKNPSGIIVERNISHSASGIHVHTFKFPLLPLLGKWSVMASYGPKFAVNKTVSFQLQEYVLPTFSVKVNTPKHVLPNKDRIAGNVEVKYVYKEPVVGTVFVKFSVLTPNDELVTIGYIARIEINRMGFAMFTLNTSDIFSMGSDFSFPAIVGSKLVVEARATEMASGKQETTTVSHTMFAKSPYIISFEKAVKYFKPLLPYDCKIMVKSPDGMPAANVPLRSSAIGKDDNGEEVDVQGWQNRDLGVTDEEGIVVITLNVPGAVKSLEVLVLTADNAISDEYQAEASFKPEAYSSPSESYIAILPSQRVAELGQHLEVKVLANNEGDIKYLNYMILSRGKVVMAEVVKSGDTVINTLTVRITRDMVPEARLVVYYIRQNQASDPAEVVADSVILHVQQLCSNPITVRMPKNEYKPGDSTRVTIETTKSVDSTASLMAVDKAVYLLAKQDVFTAKKMFSQILKADLGCTPGGGRTGLDVFKDAGLTTISNVNLEGVTRSSEDCAAPSRKRRSTENTEPLTDVEVCCRMGKEPQPGPRNKQTCRQQAIRIQHASGACRTEFYKCCEKQISARPVFAAQSRRRSQEVLSAMAGDQGGNDIVYGFEWIDEGEDALQTKRNYFPESWLFQTFDVVGGSVEVQATIPDSITTWVLQGVAMSPTDGMCVADFHNVTVKKDFFVQVDLPYSAVQGEQLEVKATVFNYMDNGARMPVKMYMVGTEHICSGVLPGAKSQAKMFFVNPGEAKTISWPILPLKAGEYVIEVQAYTVGLRDIIEKNLLVKFPGTEEVITMSKVLDPSGVQTRVPEGGQIKQELFDLNLPDDAIPGSENCAISIIGNLMGPTVSTVISGLEKKFRVPTGCGEQTMIYLAPIVYSALYMESTGKLSGDVEEKAYGYIEKGIKRQKNFYRPESCFSVWTDRKRYPCSTWLTAFVVKVYAQSRPFSQLMKDDPDDVLCRSADWLVNQQNAEGRYKELYRVHHREMTGGVHGDASLTAFVLIAMLEAECNQLPNDLVDLEANYRFETRQASIVKARQFLEQQIATIRRPYTMAITAYALALANSAMKNVSNAKLKEMVTFNEDNNLRFWGHDDSVFGSGKKPYWYYKKPDAISVETTSYALLTQLLHNDIEYSHAISRWLVQQRSSGGMFVSTQDTVVALQALAMYSKKARLGDLNLACTIRAEVQDDYEQQLLLTEDNALEQHQFPVTHVAGGDLYLTYQGMGIANVMVETKYHVKGTRLCKFNITAEATEVQPIVSRQRRRGRREVNAMANNGGVALDIKMCARYLNPGDTGMAIIEAGVYTGFVPIINGIGGLDQLVNDPASMVSRYEVADRAVILYLEKIPSDRSHCVSFRVTRKELVGNIQPVAVKVYDYYEKDEEKCVTFYHPAARSPLLDTLCEGDQCTCAETEAPVCYGFGQPDEHLETPPTQYNKLREMACNEFDFVMHIRVGSIEKDNPFDLIHADIISVIKRGGEELVDGQHITFHKKQHRCPIVEEEQEYLVMGKDSLKYKDLNGNIRYKYLLDSQSFIMQWVKKRMARNGSRDMKDYRKAQNKLSKTQVLCPS